MDLVTIKQSQNIFKISLSVINQTDIEMGLNLFDLVFVLVKEALRRSIFYN